MRRLLKWFSVSLLLALLWTGWVGWRIVSFGEKDAARSADVAVVLGAAAWHVKPSPVLEERINHALDLYRRGVVKKLLFTGGFGPGAPMAESEVARDFALRHGVRAADILIETKSRSTQENITEAVRIMSGRQWRSAVLVSDPLHMLRAAAMMRDKGVTVYSSPTPTSRYVSAAAKTEFLLREIYYYNGYLVAGK